MFNYMIKNTCFENQLFIDVYIVVNKIYLTHAIFYNKFKLTLEYLEVQ